eukprot:2082326-Rhodomonas_salina.1
MCIRDRVCTAQRTAPYAMPVPDIALQCQYRTRPSNIRHVTTGHGVGGTQRATSIRYVSTGHR